MKKSLIVFVTMVTLLAFFSSALAIDRTPRESKVKEKGKPSELRKYEETKTKEGKAKTITAPERKIKKIKGTVSEKLSQWWKSQKKKKAEEKYDYFMDKNNNGIDDRLERKSKEPISTPAIRPAPKEKQPIRPAPSTKKTAEKKKTKEPRKEEKVKKIEGKKKR